MTYTTREGEMKTATDVHGYYFDMGYGSENDRLPSMQYSQLYDIIDADIARAGTLRVQAEGTSTYCISSYDFN